MNNLDLLLRKFFWLYGSTALAAALLLDGYVIWHGGTPWAPWVHFLRYDFYAGQLEYFLLAVVLQVFTTLRLRAVEAGLSGGQTTEPVLKRILNFPAELFWTVVAVGLLISGLYHSVEALLFGSKPMASVIQHLFMKLSLNLLIGMLFYAVTRRMLNPVVTRLSMKGFPSVKGRSFIRPLLVAYVCLSLVSAFELLWSITEAMALSKRFTIQVPVWTAGIVFVMGTVIFSLLIISFRKELLVLIQGIESLLGRERSMLYTKVPITSVYETGELAAAFNEMQDYYRKEHERLDRQLQLAKKTQQKLLSVEHFEYEALDISFRYAEPEEVHGDLLDAQQLNDGRIAVLSGTVSAKGMPGALIMSAALTLFRTEIRQTDSAAGMLSSLNSSLWEVLQGDIEVSMALGLFDLEKRVLQYSTAGNAVAERHSQEGLQRFKFASPPLGKRLETAYQEMTIRLEGGDRILFYGDPVKLSDQTPPSSVVVQVNAAYPGKLERTGVKA